MTQTSNTDPWAGLTASGGGDYWKWETIGQTLVGTITTKRAGTDFNGNPCPEMDIATDDGDTVTLSAEQAMLKRLVLDANPQIGDRIAISFTGEEKTAKGGTMKVFEVAVKAGDGTAPEAPAAAKAEKPSASSLL